MRTSILLLLSLLTFSLSAQEMKMSWSDQVLYDNKKDGFFNSYVDCNSKYIYVKYTNLTMTVNRKKSKIKMVAFDKLSMKKVSDVALMGFPENKSSGNALKGMFYYKTVIFENIIYIFWKKESKNKEELFVQSFDSKLTPLKKMQKIYELNATKEQKKKPEIFVLANAKINEQILIGGELAANKDESVRIEYRLLNKDFGFEASNQVTLPYTVVGRSNNFTSSYDFGADGKLHIRSNVVFSKEEIKTLKSGESTRYPIISVVELKSGAINTLNFKFENKNIFNFSYIIEPNITKIFGFFSDMNKDQYGRDTHGIFYAIVDNNTNTIKSINFSMFTKAQLDKLFAKDKEDQRKASSTKKKSKSKKKQDAAKSDEESIQSDYMIEDVQSMGDNNLVLFCSRMYNYSVTTCTTNSNGGQSCTTRYYCQKDNVTAFKINEKGDIVWASNLDRRITYSGWNRYDVSVIHDQSKFFVLYGSVFETVGSTKSGKAKKKRKDSKETRDVLEYAVFDYGTGDIVKKEYAINSTTTPKKERKSVAPIDVQVIDNRFYFDSSSRSVKALPAVLTCVVSLACPFAIMNFSNGDIYRGKGHLGTFAPVK